MHHPRQDARRARQASGPSDPDGNRTASGATPSAAARFSRLRDPRTRETGRARSSAYGTSLTISGFRRLQWFRELLTYSVPPDLLVFRVMFRSRTSWTSGRPRTLVVQPKEP